MKTIDKFILKQYLSPMVLTFFIVMFVLIIQFLWLYIDDLVGKSLSFGVILELLGHASMTLTPMGLPLATLLAAIMTLGNIGENYELLALKSAGISLPRILRPLVILVFCVSVGSYFIADRLVPYSYQQMFTIIYDIRNQKHTLEFQDGVFFNGIENMSIRVEKQDPETNLLTGIRIYRNTDPSGKMSVTVADSGYIALSDDKKYLNVTLFHGETYDEERSRQWYDNSTLQHQVFDQQNLVTPTAGFGMERSDAEIYSNNSQALSSKDLRTGIDSLQTVTRKTMDRSMAPLMNVYLFPMDTIMAYAEDTLKQVRAAKIQMSVMDSVPELTLARKKALFDNAAYNAANSKNSFSGDENIAKFDLTQLYRYKVEWNKKITLPVSIMIFFLIGAPLGAIIRKGGLGMPIVVSVAFFVFYYIIMITGDKMAKEGTWSAFSGSWIATFILLPIAVYLTYKATNDSNLLNSEAYIVFFKKVTNFFKNIWSRTKASLTVSKR